VGDNGRSGQTTEDSIMRHMRFAFWINKATVFYVLLDVATLTEVFPCCFLSCKANARV